MTRKEHKKEQFRKCIRCKMLHIYGLAYRISFLILSVSVSFNVVDYARPRLKPGSSGSRGSALHQKKTIGKSTKAERKKSIAKTPDPGAHCYFLARRPLPRCQASLVTFFAWLQTLNGAESHCSAQPPTTIPCTLRLGDFKERTGCAAK